MTFDEEPIRVVRSACLDDMSIQETERARSTTLKGRHCQPARQMIQKKEATRKAAEAAFLQVLTVSWMRQAATGDTSGRFLRAAKLMKVYKFRPRTDQRQGTCVDTGEQ